MTQEKDSKKDFALLRTRAEEMIRSRSMDHEDVSQLSPEEIQRLVHELRVHQIELEMQNEELRQAQIKQEDLKDKYLDLYDFAPVGYMTLNDKGLILEANLTDVGLLGVERKALTMMFLSSFVCKEFTDAFYFYLRQVFESQAKQTCEIKLTRSDGTVFYAQLESVPVQGESGLSNRCRTALWDITQRKRTEEGLKETHERLELALKGADLGWWDLDLTTGRGVIDKRMFEIIGYSPGDFDRTLEVWEEFVHPEDRNGALGHIQEHLQGHTDCVNHEYRIRKKSGEYVWVMAQGKIVERDKANRPLRMAGTVMDITARKSVEEKLKKSEERLDLALNAANLGLWDLDVPTGRATINERAAEIAGYTLDEVEATVDYWQNSIHPNDMPRIVESFTQNLEGLQDFFEVEYRVRAKDGNYMWLLSRGNTVERDATGKPLRMAGTFMDITDRKTTEEALRLSQERHRHISSITSDISYSCYKFPDAEYSIDWVVGAAEPILGYSVQDIMALGCWRNLVVAEDLPLFDNNVIGVPPDKSASCELRLRHKSGETVWVSSFAQCVRDEKSHDSLRLYGGLVDITERKRSEEALHASEGFLEQIVENIPNMIFVKDAAELRFVRFNRAGEELLGYKREELIGKNDYDFFPKGQADFFITKDKEVLASGKGTKILEEEIDTRLKGKRTLHTQKIPILDSNGTPQFLLGISKDITEHKLSEQQTRNLELQLLQAQKMEAVGTLAGGVAHDFNNILQIVSGYSELLLIDKNSEHPDHDNLRKINATAIRGADLVQRLMVFSRKGDSKHRPLNLNHEITQVEKLLERTLPKMIAVELSLEGKLPVINADPVQVEQILMNLAVNAKDAMPETGGTLSIETKTVALDEEYCRVHLASNPGQYVVLSVSDTGHGMSQETMQHIFEPFFTTKGVGKGTGLGLAMVYGIVKQHEGYINCSSELGRGTTFQIYFPVVPAELEEELDQESAIVLGGSETILLVDDEEFVCDMGSKLLTRAGYTVLTAMNGRDAVDRYRNLKDDISLVILDLIMPEMGGKECFQELVNIEPKIKVILSSGFLSDETTKEITGLGFSGFVQKPHTVRQLLGMVRQVLDGD